MIVDVILPWYLIQYLNASKWGRRQTNCKLAYHQRERDMNATKALTRISLNSNRVNFKNSTFPLDINIFLVGFQQQRQLRDTQNPCWYIFTECSIRQSADACLDRTPSHMHTHIFFRAKECQTLDSDENVEEKMSFASSTSSFISLECTAVILKNAPRLHTASTWRDFM